jgi:hypothetical protein
VVEVRAPALVLRRSRSDRLEVSLETAERETAPGFEAVAAQPHLNHRGVEPHTSGGTFGRCGAPTSGIASKKASRNAAETAADMF